MGLSACGGADPIAGDEPVAEAAPAVTDATVPDTLAIESSAPADPVATDAPATSDAPLTADAPVVIEMTAELAAFRDANGALVDEWSDQLAVFGDQAIEYLDNVSKAPAAPATKELSDQLIAAVGIDATDPGLITMRDFATGMSTAFAHSFDGDQDAALAVFFELQAGQQQLTAVLDELRA